MTDALTAPDTPKRIQRKRTRGWRMPENTVSVTRPGPFGNPYTVKDARACGYQGTDAELAAYCVRLFREAIFRLQGGTMYVDCIPTPEQIRSLRGKNLACWCALCARHKDGKPLGEQCADCAPCHADVLLEIANR